MFCGINLSQGYKKTNCYIAAQGTEMLLCTLLIMILFAGPLRSTVDDFWLMIWENKITDIVMLIGVIEGGKVRIE